MMKICAFRKRGSSPLIMMLSCVVGMNISLALYQPAVGDNFAKAEQALQQGDFQQALSIWIPLAQAGDPESQYRLGFLYKNGQGTQIDDSKAAYWFGKAAEN